MPTPEDKAREKIDQALQKAGWQIQDIKDVNLSVGRDGALRNFPLVSGHGFADHLLYVDGKAAGVIEAKKEGFPLIGVEVQAVKYSEGLPSALPAYICPLPFLYQSTGIETRFTNGLDPDTRSRRTFAFHRSDTLAGWLEGTNVKTHDIGRDDIVALTREPYRTLTTFRARLRRMPPLQTEGLWPAQIIAITNLEESLAQDRPRALIQMATGSGKTFTAINFIYRLIKFAGARRVLFLVERGNLGDQTLKEFQQHVSPYNNYKFTEEFIVQQLKNNQLDTTARVCIGTIQRLYSMLKGRELEEEDEEASVSGLDRLFKRPEPIEYNPAIPIETFDVIVTDECHRSIYNLWAQVLEYFDAHLIGLTATKPPYNQLSSIPDKYSWPSLLKKDGDELFDHYRHSLENLGNEKGLLGLIFNKSQNKFQDPAKLRRLIVDLIDKKDWSAMSADVKGDTYKGLLQKNAEDVKGGAGQYFTPRPLLSFA